MSWYIRLTRFLSAHMVFSQEAENSCGMASIMMINFKQKKGTMLAGLSAAGQVSAIPGIGQAIAGPMASAAISYAVTTEPAVYKAYTKVTGTPYDGSDYSDAKFFPQVLKDLGLGEWELFFSASESSFPADAAAATKTAPIIARVKWAKGAHFVVIDEFHGNAACVCDPWDGEVHVTGMPPGQAAPYLPGDAVISFSLGGSRHSYGAGTSGTFSRMMVRKKK